MSGIWEETFPASSESSTHGDGISYHPHIHYVVPGGSYSTGDETWHPSRIDFYLPVKALSKIYKAKFRDEMIRLGLLGSISGEAFEIEWNVGFQAVGESEASLKYLAPYVFRVAISDSRILKVEGRTVYFSYRKSGSNRLRTMALDVMEFIRRFLQHVLPRGFMKVRYYGCMNPNTAVSHDRLTALIELECAFELDPMPEPDPVPAPRMLCPHCGGLLVYRVTLRPASRSP